MSIGTYAQLQQAVADFSERGDLTKVIPNFIALTEAKIDRVLDHPLMSGRSTATVHTTSLEPQFVDLPPDFQTMKRMWLPNVTGTPVIQFYSEAQLALERPRWGNAVGMPKHYTIFNTQMELIPTPDTDYVLEIVYRRHLPALADDNTTNWVLTLAPDLYLYGALCHAAQYLNEPSKFAQWSQYYDMAMDDLTHHGRNFKYGGAPVAITLAGENTP